MKSNLWPFDGRRLTTTLSLRIALALLIIGVLLRAFLSGSIWLSDDEAWYWALSQDLKASYFIHPPLSMWCIRFATTIFGDSPLAVRLPSILLSTLATFWLVRLTARLGWSKSAHITALLCLTTPMLFFGGTTAGPDLPLFTFWIGMMLTSYDLSQSLRSPRDLPRKWVRLGIYAGLALLSKLTALLAIIACGIWLVFTSRKRRVPLRTGPAVALLIATAIFSPVLWREFTVGFPLFRFHFLTRHEGASPELKRWSLFWVSQLVAWGPAIVYAWFAMLKRTLTRGDEPKLYFLSIWALVPGSVFFIQPLFSPFKIHWALYAFIPVLIYFSRLAALAPTGTAPPLLRRGVSYSWCLTLLLLVALYFPVFDKLGVAAKNNFTNDFYGWESFRRLLDDLPGDLNKLPVVTNRYQLAAQAAYALGSKEQVELIPHDSTETRDWSPDSTTEPPARFLYVSDTRYHDPPDQLYPSHRCEMLTQLTKRRGASIAKEIRLALCEKVMALSAR